MNSRKWDESREVVDSPRPRGDAGRIYSKSQHNGRNKRRENSGNVASCRQSDSLYYREVTDFSRPHVNSLRLRRDLSAAGNTSSRSFPRIDREPQMVRQGLHLPLLLHPVPYLAIYICLKTSSRLRKMGIYDFWLFL